MEKKLNKLYVAICAKTIASDLNDKVQIVAEALFPMEVF